MSALYKDWFTHRAHYTSFPDVCEDDEDEGTLFSGEIGHIDGFSFYALPQASFDIEASAPPLKPQIVHGPQRKGRGGKIRRW